jgi:hypothetical protein
MPVQSRTLWAACALFFLAGPALAETHEVGPGQALSTIGEVPWESLMPGDVVRIHHRDTPYREKWVIGRSGTEDNPIIVQGVPGPQGELPVIDGHQATTRAELNYWNRPRGILKVGGTSVPDNTLPQWIIVENLHIRGAHADNTFDDGGNQVPYADNAAAFYVERAAHLVVRNCEFESSGNGIFIGANGGDTENILIQGNHVHGNGNVGSAYEHNSYTAAIDITFEGNRYGPPCTGCLGNHFKDRSAGLIVRYNWLEGGNRQLDLVDAEDSQVLVNHPSYGETFVYGNVLVERDGDGNNQIVHYGGDSGTLTDYRKGTLYFMHNTLLSTRDGSTSSPNTTLLRLSTNDENAIVTNNILFAEGGGSRLALFGGEGQVVLSGNWLNEEFRDTFDSINGGAITDDGSNLLGTDPLFEDRAGLELGLQATSAALDNALALPGAVLPEHAIAQQYVPHQGLEPRPDDGAPDLGAFERCPAPCTFADAGNLPSDAGMNDAGATTADSGQGVADAGPDDAGTGAVSDSGNIDTGEGVTDFPGSNDDAPGAGCDCSAAPGADGRDAGDGGGGANPLPLFAGVLLLLWGPARRRRRDQGGLKAQGCP